MLNWNKVLTYAKTGVSLPSGYLEKTDNEILDYLKETSLLEFSSYYPDVETTSVITSNSYYKGDVRQGYYNFFDEENLEIFGIKDCYLPIGEHVIVGHPVMGPVDFSGMKWWALDVFRSKLFKTFSNWDYSFTFKPPNKVIVCPSDPPLNCNFVVEYERSHPTDLRRIPGSLHRQFKELCKSQLMIWIGEIRTMYTDASTPFGQLTLKGEELISRGEDIRTRLIDAWTEDTIPPITLEVY